MARQEQDIHHEHKGTSYRLRPNPCACGQDAPAMQKIAVKMLLLHNFKISFAAEQDDFFDHFLIFDWIYPWVTKNENNIYKLVRESSME